MISLFVNGYLFHQVGRDKSSLPQGLLGLKSEPLEAPETESAPCFLSQKPRATRNANHYGGTANSRQEYNISESINERLVSDQRLQKKRLNERLKRPFVQWLHLTYVVCLSSPGLTSLCL